VTGDDPLAKRTVGCPGSMDTPTTPRTTRPLRSTLAGAIGAVALLALLTGCSSPSGAPTASGAAGTGVGAKWGECMRTAGFETEDPSDELVESGAAMMPGGVDEDAWTKAAATCSEQIGVERADSAKEDEWARQYDRVASCIREEYPDFPEQEPGSLVLSPDQYPRASEQGFQDRSDECMEQFASDTKKMTR
jgi:hypothetical protein